MSDIDRLDVYLHRAMAGTLERRSQARLRFAYDEAWIAEKGKPLSLSLPVRPGSFEHEECAPFFEGLLPEGDFLKAIARTLHVSSNNPFQLLTELGGECAGAISVAPAGGAAPGRNPRPPRWLSEEELASLLKELPQRPLIAVIDEVEDGGGFRLSLAGAQDKVGVLFEGERIGLSHGKPPTTGILKPPIPRVEESVANEAFCMMLAAHVEVDAAVAEPRLAGSQEYLLVHRYDRGGDAADGRIHQEDFCQALGLVPAVKYEREGGPTVADCAALIRRNFRAPARDLTAYLDALLFNFLIGNHDAHSKNYSLLLDGPEAIRLAPLYDLISTAVYAGTDRKLAVRYGGENRPTYLRGRHFDRFALDLEVKPSLVRRRAVSICERLQAAVEVARNSLPRQFQDRPVIEMLIEVFRVRSEILARRAAEPGELVTEAPIDDQREALAQVDRSTESITEGMTRFVAALDRVMALVDERSKEDLAEDLREPALWLKARGRDVYDEIVEFGAGVEGMLETLEHEGELTRDDVDFLDGFIGLAETVNQSVEAAESVYSAISEMERVVPGLRAPLRNVRAGLRDLIDTRAIISEWGHRAEVLKRLDEAER